MPTTIQSFNVNREQAAAFRHLLAEHPGEPLNIGVAENGYRYLTFPISDVTYEIDREGEIQGAVPKPA